MGLSNGCLMALEKVGAYVYSTYIHTHTQFYSSQYSNSILYTSICSLLHTHTRARTHTHHTHTLQWLLKRKTLSPLHNAGLQLGRHVNALIPKVEKVRSFMVIA